MKSLGDYIHSKGLKFGIYGDRGSETCYFRDNMKELDTKSGSKGTEDKDANTFASWGVDYLKYDNCLADYATMQKDYEKMRDALVNCGRDIVYSICAWEFQPWMPNTGNLWRTTTDILNIWKKSSSNWSWGILDIIDLNEPLASYAKPGAWNDPDMLQVGNYGTGGPTDEEYRTHFSLWCIMAAPLILGNDIRNMKQVTKDIILNKEVIAINQDSAGIQGTKIKSSSGIDIWCKPLGSKTGDTKAVALFNRNLAASTITINFSDLGFAGEVVVRDVWAKTDKGKFTNSFTMNVPAHGTAILKISKLISSGILEAQAKNTIGMLKKMSYGTVCFTITSTNKVFDASVFSPDGRLVTRINDVKNDISMAVKSSGIYIVDINSNGKSNRQIVSIYR